MEIILELEFLKHLCDIREKAYKEKNDLIICEISKIYALLFALKVKLLISKEHVYNILTKKEAGKSLKEYELLLLNIHLQTGGFGEKFFFTDGNCSYHRDLLLLSNKNCEKTEKEQGVLIKGIDFSGNNFYKECMVSSRPLINWESYLECKVPCNSIIIVDPYLFVPKNKLPSLLEFIEMMGQSLLIPLHVTIFTSTKMFVNGNWKESTPESNIQNAMEKLAKYYVNVFAFNQSPNSIKKYGKIRDRKIYTTYSTISIGHPFDKHPTDFSQNFLGGFHDINNIKKCLNNFLFEIQQWKRISEDILNNEKGNYWETQPFTNRLFN